jgi:hypothetical protein
VGIKEWGWPANEFHDSISGDQGVDSAKVKAICLLKVIHSAFVSVTCEVEFIATSYLLDAAIAGLPGASEVFDQP